VAARRIVMPRPEHERILQDTDRSSGRDALRNNVTAAVALADAIRSTLGPAGLDKMLVAADGKVEVTNDGVTVLEAAKVEHPTAKMLISTSSAQDDVACDGTTSAILLMAEMLVNGLEYIDRGVHPVLIQNGYRKAAEWATKTLDEISRDATEREVQRSVVMTSLAGKTNETVRVLLSDLAVEAAHAVAQFGVDSGVDSIDLVDSTNNQIRADPSHIKRIGARGGNASDTRLVNGLMLAKRRLDQRTSASSSRGKIMLLDGGIAPRSPNIQAQIKVSEAGALAKFIEREKAEMQNRIEAIASIGCDLLIVRDGIDDEAVSMLREAGIVTYRRVERDELDLLARATGATLIRDPLRVRASDLGDFESRNEKKIDDIEHVTIIGSKIAGQTLLVRGSTETLIAEVQRGFDDAIGVACGLIEEPRIVPGGGATWIALARALRRRAPEADGREQLAVEAYAAALEVIPRVLAENAGLNPLEMLLATSAEQATNDDAWLGLVFDDMATTEMAEAGIIEPIRIARQAIAGATEAAISVLRIDDVLWAKQDPQTPDWQSDVESDD